MLTYFSKMPYLLAVWTFCIDSFALVYASNCKSHTTSIACFPGLLGFLGWLLWSLSLRYEYPPNLITCTSDIFSSPAAALSYFIRFVRKSVTFQSLSIAFSLIVSFVVPITIWPWIANSPARQPFVHSQKWLLYQPLLPHCRLQKMFHVASETIDNIHNYITY